MNSDLGLLVLRLVIGGVIAAHGLQKFGLLRGGGLNATAGGFAQLGFRPGWLWARVSAVAESVGGLVTMLGLGGPLGPIVLAANMLVVMLGVHRRNGFWNRQSGIEFSLSLAAGAMAIAFVGNGGWSLDAALGIALPSTLTTAWAVLMATGAFLALLIQRIGHPAATDQARPAKAA